MLYISCLQPTGVSPALNNGRRASSSSSSVSQQKTLMKKKKKEEENAACQFTFLLDKPGCMDARMDGRRAVRCKFGVPVGTVRYFQVFAKAQRRVENGRQSRGSIYVEC